ncbi:hypothetical protein Tco_1155245 [Tanacetum coccineum]
MLWEWRGIANLAFIQLGWVSRVDEMILARVSSGFAGEEVWEDIQVVPGFVGRERRLYGKPLGFSAPCVSNTSKFEPLERREPSEQSRLRIFTYAKRYLRRNDSVYTVAFVHDKASEMFLHDCLPKTAHLRRKSLASHLSSRFFQLGAIRIGASRPMGMRQVGKVPFRWAK